MFTDTMSNVSDNGTERGTVERRHMKVIWAQNNNNNNGTLEEDTRGERLLQQHEFNGNGDVKNKQTNNS